MNKSKPTSTRRKKVVVVIPEAKREMVAMGTIELVAHGQKGSAQMNEAGLEFYRRAQKKLMVKAQAAA